MRRGERGQVRGEDMNVRMNRARSKGGGGREVDAWSCRCQGGRQAGRKQLSWHCVFIS